MPKQTIAVKNVINLKCDGLPLLKKLQMVDTPLNHQLLSHSDWGEKALRGNLRVNSVLLINKVPEIDSLRRPLRRLPEIDTHSENANLFIPIRI